MAVSAMGLPLPFFFAAKENTLFHKLPTQPCNNWISGLSTSIANHLTLTSYSTYCIDLKISGFAIQGSIHVNLLDRVDGSICLYCTAVSITVILSVLYVLELNIKTCLFYSNQQHITNKTKQQAVMTNQYIKTWTVQQYTII